MTEEEHQSIPTTSLNGTLAAELFMQYKLPMYITHLRG